MDLVRLLADPVAYPPAERPDRVEIAETHISWLFFAGSYVYKVKKPVDFGFLDFTTLATRRHYCEEELRLNRRLSPDVYLAVVPLGWRDERLAVGAEPAVEWAVKMRRLPDGRWLSQVLDRDGVSADTIRTIARRIAQFHAGAATDERIRREGGTAAVRINTEENFAQTTDQIGLTLTAACHDRVAAFTRAFLAARADLFARREREGRIRDCHGDLHADQISLENGIAFIDCIVFNERFRCGDVAADIAFTAMDLEYHGHPELARVLVEEYLAASGDEGVRSVIDFYRCYRAFTRGKVRGFRLRQTLLPGERAKVIDQSSRYYRLAARYAALPGPLLLATCGLMGTGKSTLAAGLAERLDATVISSDLVRKELAGLQPNDPRRVEWGQDIYDDEMTAATYRELHRRAAAALAEGRVVLLDASHREARWRRAARDLADSLGVPFLLLWVGCPDASTRDRLGARREGPSDGRTELLERQRAAFEPPVELAASQLIEVDTAGPPGEVVRVALEAIYRARLSSAG